MKTFKVYRRTAKQLKTDVDTHNYLPSDDVQFEGVVFSDGQTVIRWRTAAGSTSIWDNLEDMKAVHIRSHPDYGTEIHWNDGQVEYL